MPATANPMFNDNPFKLGLFAMNADGGLTMTRVPERWQTNWPNTVKLAQMADEAGLEIFLPLARWKGYGGETNARNSSFETFTFAAGIAQATKRIACFQTVHVPIVHPVFAAKALATVDHIARGRSGLNIVCGWNVEEFDMFGHVQQGHDARYDQGFEWLEIITKIYAGKGEVPFDYDGKFYHLKNVVGAPAPIQVPRPPVISAAFSPAGRDFAARTSDFIFVTFSDFDGAQRHIADIRQRAAQHGRQIGVFAPVAVVVRDTQKEAEDYYEHYAVTMEDKGAVDHHMHIKETQAQSHEADAFRLYRKRFAGGTGSYPLVGTPDKVASELVAMHRAGFAGTVLTFVDYLNEFPYFTAKVLPLLEQAGLRRPDTLTRAAA